MAPTNPRLADRRDSNIRILSRRSVLRPAQSAATSVPPILSAFSLAQENLSPAISLHRDPRTLLFSLN